MRGYQSKDGGKQQRRKGEEEEKEIKNSPLFFLFSPAPLLHP
jgi:hypothetical protein